MAIVTLEQIPNQSLSVTITGRRFDIRIFDLGSGMAVDVVINNVPVVRAQRLLAGVPFLPYRYQEAGNLILVTDGAEPDWRLFGVTQALVTLDEAGDPVSSVIPAGGGSGGGPGPTPTPGAYLEKSKNLSDLANVATALVNLGVYSQEQVDELLSGFLVADQNLSDLTDPEAARDALSVLSGAEVLALLAALPTPPSAATVAQYRAGTGAGFLSPTVAADALDYVTFTRANVASGGLDFDTFVNARIVLDANLTVGGWIVSFTGASGRIRFVQDATGGRTVAWPSGYIVPSGFSLQTTAGGITDIPYVCEADNKIRLYNPSKWTA